MNSQDSHNEELKIAERIAYLVIGFLLGTLTPEEGEDLDEWIGGSDENLALLKSLRIRKMSKRQWLNSSDRTKQNASSEAREIDFFKNVKPLFTC